MHDVDALASLQAARLAAVIGKLGRGRELGPEEREYLQSGAAAARSLRGMVRGRTSYFTYRMARTPAAQALEYALLVGLLGDDEVAKLTELMWGLERLARAEDPADIQDVTFLHDFFASLARAINARLTHAPEIFKTWS